MIPLGRAGAEAAVMSGALSARGEHDDDEDEGALSTGSVGAVGGGSAEKEAFFVGSRRVGLSVYMIKRLMIIDAPSLRLCRS